MPLDSCGWLVELMGLERLSELGVASVSAACCSAQEYWPCPRIRRRRPAFRSALHGFGVLERVKAFPG